MDDPDLALRLTEGLRERPEAAITTQVIRQPLRGCALGSSAWRALKPAEGLAGPGGAGAWVGVCGVCMRV